MTLSDPFPARPRAGRLLPGSETAQEGSRRSRDRIRRIAQVQESHRRDRAGLEIAQEESRRLRKSVKRRQGMVHRLLLSFGGRRRRTIPCLLSEHLFSGHLFSGRPFSGRPFSGIPFQAIPFQAAVFQTITFQTGTDRAGPACPEAQSVPSGQPLRPGHPSLSGRAR